MQDKLFQEALVINKINVQINTIDCVLRTH